MQRKLSFDVIISEAYDLQSIWNLLRYFEVYGDSFFFVYAYKEI